MNALQTIEERRSIRRYTDDVVTKEQIIDILNCGRLAPSAKNRQPWYFVVTAGEKKNTIAGMMKEALLNETENGQSSVLNTADIILNAPVLVLIFYEKDKNWLVGDNLSIGACVENMCLRAVELGLGTLWIRDTYIAAPQIAEYCNKQNMTLNCALAIGVPAVNPLPRPRKKLEQITEWQM